MLGNLPAALLLAVLARRSGWAAVLGAGWIVLALLELTAFNPLVATLVHGLTPAPDGFFFLGPLVAAAALAALWRWDADPPPLRLPTGVSG